MHEISQSNSFFVDGDPDYCICNRCKKVLRPESPIDWQERFKIEFRGGYGSVFGDDEYFSAVFCQECMKDLVGKFLS